jgi:hypothetical protein
LENNSTFGQRKGEKTNENQKDFKAEERNHPLGKFHSHHNVTLAVYVGEYRIVYMQFVQNIQFVLHHLPVSSKTKYPINNRRKELLLITPNNKVKQVLKLYKNRSTGFKKLKHIYILYPRILYSI